MSEPVQTPRPSDESAGTTESIVDLVFAGELGGRMRRLAAGGACVVALYATAMILVEHFGPSGATLCAEMAARVHDAIAAERAVDVTPPPPPPPPPAQAPPTPRVAEPVARAHTRAPVAHHAPAAPAQAGKLAAVSDAPVDFTGSAFVVGSGPAYAGGTTTSTGTSKKAVTGLVAPNGTGDGKAARSRARPVSLDQAAWNCPWPAEADARQVDQETVVIRVAVGADGRADHVDVLEDPGNGFGAAARQCALVTQFGAAHGASGQPIAALSPPIRVHFYR